MLHKIIRRIWLAISLLVVVLLTQTSVAQSNSEDRAALVDSLFNTKQYAEAIPYLEDLLQSYPKEPTYHYQLGVSYLNASRDLGKAIQYLQYASTQDVPALVYYYLGRAYQLNYQFDDAISYYRRYTINSSNQDVSVKEIEALVSECENGEFMLKYIYEPKISDIKRVEADDFSNFVVTKPADGNFIQTPKDLLTKEDLKQNYSSLIFYPNNPEPGDKIVYSSYGLTTTYGTDLFIIEMLDDGFWSKPQNLGDVINSALDEDYPYLAPDGQTLYFASKGHYSMGGFDIYRSVYNPSAGRWNDPENLGFPISSPYDDFFYIPDIDDEYAVFMTNRNVATDSVDVVLMAIDDSPIRRSFDNIENVWRIGGLYIDDAGSEQNGTASSHQPDKKQRKSLPKSASASYSAVENDAEYARALANGFKYQMQADSLREKLEKLRSEFDYITTAEQRKKLEAKVVAVENDLLSAQRSADIHFGNASKIEQEYLTGKRSSSQKTDISYASDKPDFLYQIQYASTVFQADELRNLANLEKLVPRVQQQRAKVQQEQQKLNKTLEQPSVDSAEYARQYADYLDQLKGFNSLLSSYIGGKKKHYSDCISVALIKADANDNSDIKAHIDRATSHFRSATAIRNNATPSEQVESEYEALLLDELGVVRLEIAFAKLWGVHLFVQQQLSKIYRLEQDIFGYTLPSATQKTRNELVNEPSVDDSQEQNHLTITRDDSKPLATGEFEFEPDKEPPFQILDKTPYSKDNPIPAHLPLPKGLIYKIQFAVFSQQVKFSVFKGMTPLWFEPLRNGAITKYFAGNFRHIADAEEALPEIRKLGFNDAFIVAWYDGRSVSLSRAKSLEETEAQRPVVTDASETRIDIKQDAALYVVELRVMDRLSAEDSQTIRALALGKDIIRKSDGKGGHTYSIGSFTNLDEANRVKDNLIASGIKNAFVVAVDTDN